MENEMKLRRWMPGLAVMVVGILGIWSELWRYSPNVAVTGTGNVLVMWAYLIMTIIGFGVIVSTPELWT